MGISPSSTWEFYLRISTTSGAATRRMLLQHAECPVGALKTCRGQGQAAETECLPCLS